MKTQKRIEKIFENVKFVAEKKFHDSNDLVLADIGTDHGYVAELMSKYKKAKKVIATDISLKSLHKLENLKENHELEKIESSLGDGLDAVESADIAVIAGIGGMQITKMLEFQNKNHENLPKCIFFVLQPAQNEVELRKWLYKNQFDILRDRVIFDNNQFYSIIVVDSLHKVNKNCGIREIYLGKNRISDPDFQKYLLEMQTKLSFIDMLPKSQIKSDEILYEKYKLKILVEKLMKKY